MNWLRTCPSVSANGSRFCFDNDMTLSKALIAYRSLFPLSNSHKFYSNLLSKFWSIFCSLRTVLPPSFGLLDFLISIFSMQAEAYDLLTSLSDLR